MCPVTAAAATMAGLIRCVRAPAPWRPSKLRLVLEAQRSPGPQDVVVHGEAHGAAGLAPFEAGLDEDTVEPFGLGLTAHLAGAGHDDRADAVGDPASAQHAGGVAQILDAGIGAGADEGMVDADRLHRHAGRQAHVVERPRRGAAARPGPVRHPGPARGW